MAHDLQQAVAVDGAIAHPVPGRQESPECARLDGLHVAPQHGERAPAQPTQHLDVDPFLTVAVRAVCARRNPALGFEPSQDLFYCARRQPQGGGGVGGIERPVGPGVSRHDIAKRVSNGIEEREWHASWRRDPERVAQSGHVFDCGEGSLPADGHFDRPVAGRQLVAPPRGVVGVQGAGGDLGGCQRTEVAQHVVELVGRLDLSLRCEALQLELDRGYDLRIEQLAKRRFAEQLAQQGMVEGERCRPFLGDGGVVLVHERRDEVEHQRGGERAGAVERNLTDSDRAA